MSAHLEQEQWEFSPAGQADHSNAAYNIRRRGAKPSAGRIAHIPASETKPTRAYAALLAAAPRMYRRLWQIQYELEDIISNLTSRPPEETAEDLDDIILRNAPILSEVGDEA